MRSVVLSSSIWLSHLRKAAGRLAEAFSESALTAGRPPRGLVVLGIALAILVRSAAIKFESGDYGWFLQPWCDYIRSHGGVHALRDAFSNYPPAYLHLLVMAIRLPIEQIVAIKAISIAFDFALAFAARAIVAAARPSSRLAPWAAFFGILFAPTVVANGSVWAQCDAIYTSFAFLAIALLVRGHRIAPVLALGMGLAFKQQVLFVLPAFAVFALKRRVPIAAFALLPVPFFLLALPSWWLGRPLHQVLLVYQEQASGQPGLNYGAINFFQWLTNAPEAPFTHFGLLFTGAALFFLVVLCVRSTAELTPTLIVLICLESSLVAPFFLPRMHERYFYMADALAVTYAVLRPSRAWIAITVVTSSGLSYLNFLFSSIPVELPTLSLFLLIALIGVSFDLVRALELGGRASCLAGAGRAPPTRIDPRVALAGVLGVGVLFAAAMRVSLFGVEPGNFASTTGAWLERVRTQGGGISFRHLLSSRTPVAAWALAATSWRPASDLVVIKAATLAYDLALAAVVSALVARLCPGNRLARIAAFFFTLFTPAIVLSGAYEARTDSLFVGLALAAVWRAMEGDRIAPAVLYAVALFFYPTAVVLLPAMCALAAADRISTRALVLVPSSAVVLLAILTWKHGRPPWDLLVVYRRVLDCQSLTCDAPSLYMLFPDAPTTMFSHLGLALTLGLAVVLGALGRRIAGTLSPSIQLQLALTSALGSALLLPGMSQRSFLLADALALLYAFAFPRRFWVPIVAIASSFTTFVQHELGSGPIHPRFLMFLLATLLAVASFDLARATLWPRPPAPAPAFRFRPRGARARPRLRPARLGR